MSSLGMMLLIVLLLLPLATCDGDGQAIQGGGGLSAVRSPDKRLDLGYRKSGRSMERRCNSEDKCPNGLCCDLSRCTCKKTQIRVFVYYNCDCPDS
nr:conotoxin N M15.4 [Conus magus]